MKLHLDFAVALAVCVAGWEAAGLQADESSVPGPNVIFILADDLGYADLGCYGQKKIRTPCLDRMAAEGIRFTQHYAGSPVCAPSRGCLMTGKHGGHAWIRSNQEVQPEGQPPIPDREVTIAELFKKQGYATAAIGKWGLGYPGSEGDPLRQGFDLFFGYNCQRHAHNHYPAWLWHNDKRVELEGNDGGATGQKYSHDLFEAEALKFIRVHKNRPFFLYLPFTVPHWAIQVPEDSLAEYQGQWDDAPFNGTYDEKRKRGYHGHPAPRAGYAAMVTRLDRSVGRVLDLLKELRLDEKTLVMFSSDNGPISYTDFFNSAGGLRGVKGSVYEGGIRTPLLARWPGKIKPGTVSDHASYFPDLLPTLMEIIGSAEKVPRDVDGISFAPTLLGQPERQRQHSHLFWEFAGSGGQQAVRLGDWKGVRTNLHKGNLKIELYDLQQDPEEKHDVADRHPQVVQRIEMILKADRISSKLFPIKVLDGR